MSVWVGRWGWARYGSRVDGRQWQQEVSSGNGDRQLPAARNDRVKVLIERVREPELEFIISETTFEPKKGCS